LGAAGIGHRRVNLRLERCEIGIRIDLAQQVGANRTSGRIIRQTRSGQRDLVARRHVILFCQGRQIIALRADENGQGCK